MLIYKHTMDARDSDLAKKFAKYLGIDTKSYEGPSWPLPNLKEVAEKDFWSHAMSYSFAGEMYRSAIQLDGEWWNVRIFLVDHSQLMGGGYAVLFSHKYQHEKVRYFQWRDCDHVFEHKLLGNCWHGYTCTKCKRMYDVDSSG